MGGEVMKHTAGPAGSPGGTIVLDPRAEAMLALLAGQRGTGLLLPVVAALADLPTAAAERHLGHLQRLGMAHRHGAGRFWADEQGLERRSLAPAAFDGAARSRVTKWYAASVFAVAQVLGVAALPDGETIPADPGRPPQRPVGPGEALEWFITIRSELLTVLRAAVEDGDVHSGWRLAVLMLNVLCLLGADWQETVELGCRAAQRAGHGPALGMVLEYQGKLLLTNGNLAAAQCAQEEALQVRAEAGDRLGIIRSTNALGLIHLRGRDFQLALEYFERTLQLARDGADDEFVTFGRMNRGAALARLGRSEPAIVELEQACLALRAGGRLSYLANALQDLAYTHRIAGQRVRGLEIALEAVEVAEACRIPMSLPGVLVELAAHRTDAGEHRLALAHLQEAQAIYEYLLDRLNAARVSKLIEQFSRSA